MSEIVELEHSFGFEAAHSLPNVPEGHKCRRLHGHSFRCTVTVRGPIDEHLGWLIDYADIKEAVRPIRAALDHYHLNEIDGLENPTSENLAVWIWRRLARSLPSLREVRIAETCTNSCAYRGPDGADPAK